MHFQLKSLVPIAVLTLMSFQITAQSSTVGNHNASVSDDEQPKGRNSAIDVTTYFARPVATVPTSTANCVSGNFNVVLTGGPSTFIDHDGVVLYGCGGKPSLTDVCELTAVPGDAIGGIGTGHMAAGSGGTAQHSYQVAPIDSLGGIRPASDAIVAKGAAATLGTIVTNVIRRSRASNVVTIVTSGPNGATVGASFFDQGGADASFSGEYIVRTVENPTTFTALEGMDARGQNPGVDVSSGGNVSFFVGVHISWETENPADTEYAVLKDGVLAGITHPGETFWDDFGQALPPLPSWLNTSAVKNGANEYLATTIISGARTRTLTLAAAPAQTVAEAVVKFDDTPTVLAAYNTAVTNGTDGALRFPAGPANSCYVFNSHLAVSSPAALTIIQAAPLCFNERVTFSSALTWTGELGGALSAMAQFAYGAAQQVFIGTAYPGVEIASPFVLKHLLFSAGANSTILDISGGQQFNSKMDTVGFTLPGTDYAGEAVSVFGSANITYDRVLFSTNDSGTYGYSIGPLLYVHNDIGNINPSGSMICRECFFVGRGFLADSFPVVGANHIYEFESNYAQALRTPLVTIANANGALVHIRSFTNDTSITPIIANAGSNGMFVILEDLGVISGDTGGRPGVVSGTPVFGIIANNVAGPIGQNRDVFWLQQNAFASIPDFSATKSRNVAAPTAMYNMWAPLSMGDNYEIFWPIPAPAPIRSRIAATAGGKVPVGTVNYSVTSVSIDTGESAQSVFVVCTTSPGNQTCTPSWNAVPGATFYNVYRGNSSGSVPTNGVVRCTHITATACSDTVESIGGYPPPLAAGGGITALSAAGLIGPNARIGSLSQTSAGQFAGTGKLEGGTLSITFPTAYVSSPVCQATDNSAVAAVRTVSTTTTLTITGTSGDMVSWLCVGNPN
jgi:hypothetical protein